jgi:hypothetical protein
MSEGEKKTMVRIGDDDYEVVDPLDVQYVVADCYTEIRVINGMASVSLASTVLDGNGAMKANVVARLRFSPSLLLDLTQKVGVMISDPSKMPKA